MTTGFAQGDPLVTKLAGIVLEVKHVEKRGRNEHHKYDYVTESDMVEALRAKLAVANIICVPQFEQVESIRTDKGLLVTLRGAFTFTDGTAKFVVQVVGSGYDIPGDKAVYKAMTGAQKYALKQLFLIPTGDDPERDGEHSETSIADSVGHAARTGERGAGDAAGLAPNNQRLVARVSGPGSTGDSSRQEPTVSFGKNKGKKLSELSDGDLAWWTKVMEENVAKNDEKWHKKNEQNFRDCQQEWARRQPWRKIWSDILSVANDFELDKEGAEGILKDIIGVSQADKLEPQHLDQFRDYLKQTMATEESES